MLLLHWPLLPRPPAALIGACPIIHELRRWRSDPQAKLRALVAMAAVSFETRPSSYFEAWSWLLATTRELRRLTFKPSFEQERSWRPQAWKLGHGGLRPPASFKAWPWLLATTRELRRSRSNPQAKLGARAVMAAASFEAWP